MPASSKRAKRVKMRERDAAHTGIHRKAKKEKFDTKNENPEKARELGNRKKFHPHDLATVSPLNDNQTEFLQCYFQGAELIVADGPAGTAKTFLSMYCALNDVFSNDTPQSKIYVARAAVPSRNQGFLPGDEDEKNEPFEAPYKQITKELMPTFNDPYSHLKSLGYLEFVSTSYLRGVTLHDAIIIVDEFSSCTYHELSTIITRVGHNTKIIFAGDFKQSDLDPRREESGYHKFLKVISKMPQEHVAHIRYELDDIVRSGLVKDFLISDFHNG